MGVLLRVYWNFRLNIFLLLQDVVTVVLCLYKILNKGLPKAPVGNAGQEHDINQEVLPTWLLVQRGNDEPADLHYSVF